MGSIVFLGDAGFTSSARLDPQPQVGNLPCRFCLFLGVVLLSASAPLVAVHVRPALELSPVKGPCCPLPSEISCPLNFSPQSNLRYWVEFL